eukprot:scaffold98_cov248-Ochromonas_danica.AAC.5
MSIITIPGKQRLAVSPGPPIRERMVIACIITIANCDFLVVYNALRILHMWRIVKAQMDNANRSMQDVSVIHSGLHYPLGLRPFFTRCVGPPPLVAHKTCGHHSSTSLVYDHNASCEDDGWSACLAGESTERCNPRGKGALLSPAHGLLLLIVPVSSALPIALILVVGLDEANDRLGADEVKT